MNYLEYSQLWREEPEILKKRVCLIPDGGILIEIGTAEGGTTRFLYEQLKNKDVKICTIDIKKTKNADLLLEGTNVELVTGKASEYAKHWGRNNNKVDFLFIDGDHSFFGIYQDFFAWVNHIKIDSTIAFHDYDPKERGGVAHLGVKVFIDTLIVSDIFQDPSHEFRFLFCRLNKQKDHNIPIAAFFNTFIKMGEDIILLKNRIFKNSAKSCIEIIQKRDFGINSFQASYIIDYLLKECYESVINFSNDANEVRRLAEMYFMLIHAYGDTNFPYNIQKIKLPSDETEMSIIIAREHVKLQILKNILKRIVTWIP